MRSWQVHGVGEPADVLEIVGGERPHPGDGQVRLRVTAAALGLPDVLMCRGTYPLTPALPFIPGQEVVGVVTAAGDGVDPHIVGERVMGVSAFYAGWGGFATETLAAARTVHVAPRDMTDTEAAAFYIPFHTAWIGLHQRAELAEGETLLVLGAAGGSGAAAVQVGVALGASVIAVAGGAAKAEFCRRMGATTVIDHTVHEVAPAVLEATGGRGVDVVFDPVGGEAAVGALGVMASEGRFLLVGFASGSWAELDPSDLVQRNYSAVGVYAGAYDRGFSEAAHGRLVAMWEAGRLASLVTDTIAFEDVPQALTVLAERSAIGKVVLLVDS